MDAPEQHRKHRIRVIAAPVAAVAVFTALGFGGTVRVRAQLGGPAALGHSQALLVARQLAH